MRSQKGKGWNAIADILSLAVVLFGLNTLIEMGMKEGFNQGLDQLEALLVDY